MKYKLIDHLERDLRNAVVIDRLKQLSWKGKLIVHFNRNGFYYACGFCALAWLLGLVAVVRADDAKVQCPTAEPCRVLVLTAQEEKILTAPNGVLDTAAQGRALELGQFVVYLKQRISSSPMGDPPPKQDLTVPQK